MNNSTAVFLINKDVRAIRAHYELDNPEKNYKAPRELFKTLDPRVKVGDLIMVPSTTRHKVTVVKVSDVDVEVDHSSGENCRWVIGVVDQSLFENCVAKEATLFTAIKAGEKKQQEAKLRETLLASVPEDELKALPIYKNGDAEDQTAPAPEAPPRRR